PSSANRAKQSSRPAAPSTTSRAPTQRSAAMPKKGGPIRQPAKVPGTTPATTPGATQKKSAEPSRGATTPRSCAATFGHPLLNASAQHGGKCGRPRRASLRGLRPLHLLVGRRSQEG